MNKHLQQLKEHLEKEFPIDSERVAEKIIQHQEDRRRLNDQLAKEDLRKPEG